MNDKDIETALGEIARLAKIGRMCENACAYATKDLGNPLGSHDTPDARGITFAVGQKYTFTRTSFCGDTFKDYKRGDTIIIRRVSNGVVDFDNGKNISSATEEYLRDMISDGVITLTTQRVCYETVLSSVTDTVGLPKPGQVYEFTKDCVFFDDISGDYKGYTIKAGTTLTISDDLKTKEEFNISSKHPVRLSCRFIMNAVASGDIKVIDVTADNGSGCMSILNRGQVYRAARDGFDTNGIVAFRKDDTIRVHRVCPCSTNVTVRIDGELYRVFDSIRFLGWINEGILVLDDGSVEVKVVPERRNESDDSKSPLKVGQVYEVVMDVRIEGPHKSSISLHVGDRLSISKYHDTVEKFKWSDSLVGSISSKWLESAIIAKTIRLVNPEFKGEIPCEFKTGMKFKFTKEFARVCGVIGNDFYPGDTISLGQITGTDIAIINDRGYDTGTVKIEWLRERIKDGTLVPFADDQTSGSDDDMCFYDGEKFVAEMMFEFRPQDESIGSIVIDEGQLITLGVNRDATEDKKLSLHHDGKLLCYISRCMLIRLIQHDRLKIKDSNQQPHKKCARIGGAYKVVECGQLNIRNKHSGEPRSIDLIAGTIIYLGLWVNETHAEIRFAEDGVPDIVSVDEFEMKIRTGKIVEYDPKKD